MTENMQGPDFLKYFPAIIEALRARGGFASASEIFEDVFERVGVSAEEREIVLPSGEKKQRNQVRWARFYLLRAGLMGAASRGEWRLTAAGMKADLRVPGATLNLYRKTHEHIRGVSPNVDSREEAERQVEESESAGANGVEEEVEGSTAESESPYDATKTQINTRAITIGQLNARIEHDEIDLQPDFQRRAHLWSLEQKSRLIESILLRIPLPMFYFDATNDDLWLVVDGLQRLSTFHHFMVEREPGKRLALRGLEYLRQFEGKTFDLLPRDMQRRIEETQVFAHLIAPGTPRAVKFNIFRRINTGGLVLTAQEIRHALYGHGDSAAARFLQDLADSAEFLSATSGAVSPERMLDLEFVLRFAAFSITHHSKYRDKGMDDFLNRHMEVLNDARSTKERQQLAERFRRAMVTAQAIFGPHAFRKYLYEGQARKPINKALFETWAVTLGRCSEEECARLIQHRAAIFDRTRKALNDDPAFETAVTQGTGDPKKVHLRFESVEGIVRAVLEAH